MFYHFNGRLHLTNGLLIVPDDETSEGTEKICLKDLYEMFQGTKSLGLVSLQFLCALDIFIGGDIILSKNALTELCYNLSYETLSGGWNFKFEAISGLVADTSFQMKKLKLSNLKRKWDQDKKSANDIKNSYEFFDEGDNKQKFEDELKEDLFKQLDLIETKDEYVEPTVLDLETIEKETKKEDNKFLEQQQNLMRLILQLQNKKNRIILMN